MIKKVIVALLICIFVTLVQSSAHATEAVVCGNDKTEIYVYYNLGDKSYGGIALYIDNEMIKSDWKTKKATSDFKKMTIFLQATGKKSDKTITLKLNVSKKKGELRYGDKTHIVTCDWSAFNEDK